MCMPWVKDSLCIKAYFLGGHLTSSPHCFQSSKTIFCWPTISILFVTFQMLRSVCTYSLVPLIWEILTSHNIIRLPNYIKGGFTFALISYPVDETFSDLRWRLFSIWTIYDYRWVEIAYGLEKIVPMPRTWSVRIFAKKNSLSCCLNCDT